MKSDNPLIVAALILAASLVFSAYLINSAQSHQRYELVRLNPAVAVRLDKVSGNVTLWRMRADGGIAKEEDGERDPAVVKAVQGAENTMNNGQ